MTSHSLKPEVVSRRRSNCDEFKNKNNRITVIGMLFCVSLAKLHQNRATGGGVMMSF